MFSINLVNKTISAQGPAVLELLIRPHDLHQQVNFAQLSWRYRNYFYFSEHFLFQFKSHVSN